MDPSEGQVTASNVTRMVVAWRGREVPKLTYWVICKQIPRQIPTLPDGSLSTDLVRASSGHLGLGATADPNQVTQCHDVYISYWKQHGKLSYILSSCQMVIPLPFLVLIFFRVWSVCIAIFFRTCNSMPWLQILRCFLPSFLPLGFEIHRSCKSYIL